MYKYSIRNNEVKKKKIMFLKVSKFLFKFDMIMKI